MLSGRMRSSGPRRGITARAKRLAFFCATMRHSSVTRVASPSARASSRVRAAWRPPAARSPTCDSAPRDPGRARVPAPAVAAATHVRGHVRAGRRERDLEIATHGQQHGGPPGELAAHDDGNRVGLELVSRPARRAADALRPAGGARPPTTRCRYRPPAPAPAPGPCRAASGASVRPAARATALTASSTGAARSPQMPIRLAASTAQGAREVVEQIGFAETLRWSARRAIVTRVESQNRSRQSRPGSVSACRARGASRQARPSSGPAVSSTSSSPMRRRLPCGPRARRRVHPLRFALRGQRAQQVDARKLARHIVLDEGEDPRVAAVKFGRGAGQQRVDVGAVERERVRPRHPAAARIRSPRPWRAARASPCCSSSRSLRAAPYARRAGGFAICSSNWST